MRATMRWEALVGASLCLLSWAYASAPVLNASDSSGARQTTPAVTTAANDAPVVQPVPNGIETFVAYWGSQVMGQWSMSATNSPTSWSATGTPPNVAFSTSTGMFSWDASHLGGGEYNVTVTATNSAGSGSTTFKWIIHPALSDFITTDKYQYTTGETITFTAKFSSNVVVTGSPYLPLWNDKKAMYASGSGTSTLTFTYTVAADDPVGGHNAWQIDASNGTVTTPGGTSATLTPPEAPGVPPPQFRIVLSSVPAPAIADQTISGTAGTPLSAQIAATNATSYRVISGVLPAYVTIDASTGAVSGTPTYGGTTTVIVQVSNAGGATASAYLTFAIAAGPPPPVPTISDQTFNATVGVPFTGQMVATGARNFTLISGTWPGGLSFNSSGVLSGTPMVSGTFPVMIQVDNSAGGIASAQITFVIAPATPPPPPPSPTKSDQTITFSSPVSAIIVGQPITLGATSSAGLPVTYALVSGSATISGNTLTPLSTATLVVRAYSLGNDHYNAASTDVNFGAPQKAAQAITMLSTGGDVVANNAVALDATSSSGQPVTFAVVSGPGSINGSTLSFTGTGTVVVRASQAGSDTVAAANDVTITYTAHPIPRLVNISSRLHLAAGETAIAGFVVTGSSPKKVLVRAVGDSLVALGVADPLANPHLTVFDNNRNPVTSNAGWAGDPQIGAAGNTVGAFTLKPGGTDAALIATLALGPYTAQVTSDSTGTVLLEVYDLGVDDAVPTKQLVNVSTRAHVDARNPIIQGFVVSGDEPKRVLIRAVGAPLSQFGVTDAISDPTLKVYSGSTVVAQNDDWSTPQPLTSTQTLGTGADIAAASRTVGAFALPTGSKDAALLITLPPGPYTVVVPGSAAQSGEVLIEAYDVP